MTLGLPAVVGNALFMEEISDWPPIVFAGNYA
jgi:hypothetical protein